MVKSKNNLPKIDLKDKKILFALDMNARMPITELAKTVGLSRQVVEYRIKRMQKEGIIWGAIAVFDSVVVGQKWYRVVFRLLQVNEQEKKDFLDFLANNNHVLWLGEIGGNWDIIVNVVCEDTFAFNSLLETIVQQFGNYIMDYETLIYIDVHDQSRSFILHEDKKNKNNNNIKNKHIRQEFYHTMKFNPSVKLDDLDKNIIRALSKNAFASNLELGQKYSVSANTIRNRINQLLENGILLGFRLFISARLFGYQIHMLFLEITKLNLQREKELYVYLQTIPNVTFLVKHIGKWRIGMEIETKTVEEFQRIFVDIRAKFSDIISDYQSSPIFKDYAINYFPEGCFQSNSV